MTETEKYDQKNIRPRNEEEVTVGRHKIKIVAPDGTNLVGVSVIDSVRHADTLTGKRVGNSVRFAITGSILWETQR